MRHQLNCCISSRMQRFSHFAGHRRTALCAGTCDESPIAVVAIDNIHRQKKRWQQCQRWNQVSMNNTVFKEKAAVPDSDRFSGFTSRVRRQLELFIKFGHHLSEKLYKSQKAAWYLRQLLRHHEPTLKSSFIHISIHFDSISTTFTTLPTVRLFPIQRTTGLIFNDASLKKITFFF